MDASNQPCIPEPSKSAPPAAPSTNTSASSKPIREDGKVRNASSPISVARTSSSRSSRSSDDSSPATPTSKPPIPPYPTSAMPPTGGHPRRPRPVRPTRPLGSSSTSTSAKAKGVPFADRAFALVANRLIAPASEHGLAGWLETDFVCDRQGRRFLPHWHRRRRVRVHPRQLDAWYRTLDQLIKAKDRIEVALYHRLRDLFSLKPDLVLYDITSTYFEGAGPARLRPSTATAATASRRTSR